MVIRGLLDNIRRVFSNKYSNEGLSVIQVIIFNEGLTVIQVQMFNKGLSVIRIKIFDKLLWSNFPTLLRPPLIILNPAKLYENWPRTYKVTNWILLIAEVNILLNPSFSKSKVIWIRPQSINLPNFMNIGQEFFLKLIDIMTNRQIHTHLSKIINLPANCGMLYITT